jgi:RNA polymerase sigma-70 factor (sigma-E family)
VDGSEAVVMMSDSAGTPTLTGLAARHQLAWTRFAYLLSGDRQRAEALVQDVLMGLFRRFGDQLPVREPDAYVRASIVNAHISRQRRKSSRERTFGLQPGGAATSMPADLDDRDLLWRALSRLPARQRAVLVLRFYLDFADADIAAVLGCPVGTVSSAASRALDGLKKDSTLGPGVGEERS